MNESQAQPLLKRLQKANVHMHGLGFQAKYYHYFLIVLIAFFIVGIGFSGVLYYQIWHLPIPKFYAVNTEHQRFELLPYEEPNFLPDTIIRWASKAAVGAYTFDYANYKDQLENIHKYFTHNGWLNYLQTANRLITDIRRKQIIVNGVVSGIPVISNQGPIENTSYAWVVQLPFLATYRTGNAIRVENYIVVLTIVKVPTSKDPRGMGIQEFVMRSAA